MSPGLTEARLLKLTIHALPPCLPVEDAILDCLKDMVDKMDEALVIGFSSGDEILLKGGFLGFQQNIIPDQA